MPNPLVPTRIYNWITYDVVALYYDGTNETAVKDYLLGGYNWSSTNPTTKVMTFTSNDSNQLPFAVNPNTWIVNQDVQNPLTDATFAAGWKIGPVAMYKDALIHEMATSTVKTPLLGLGVPTDITFTFDQTLGGTDYIVKFLPGAGLLGLTTMVLKSKTTSSCVVTVTSSALIAAGSSMTVLAIR